MYPWSETDGDAPDGIVGQVSFSVLGTRITHWIERDQRKFSADRIDESISQLNKLTVDIGGLRMFLASITHDGMTTVPLGTLLDIIKHSYIERNDG